MNLPELSIRRHVLAYMMNAVLLLFGLIGYTFLGVDRFPDVDIPVITITTIQPGANPSIIDASVTSIIERQVNSVPGIKNIRSSSTPSVSVVAINFELEKDIDVAFNEIQAKINQVLRELPDDADPPIVAKLETGSQPIMWLALTGDRTQQQLNTYASNVLRKQFESINGVGEVRIAGQRERVIRVELDPTRLAAYNLTVQDLVRAFSTEHFLLPGGFLVSAETETLLKLDLEYHDPYRLQDMVVGYQEGAPILLRDVADVRDNMEDFRELARFNGEPTVGLGVVKVPGTNSVAIIDEVKRRLEEEIVPQLPPGLDVGIASDTSGFILELVHALQEHLVVGTVLAGLIVLVFLRNFRSTIMIAAAIPVSLLGAVAVMYFFGYTFNSVTLLALLLLIGVVVDDAIVVLENIYRHREEIDPDPVSAAINGTEEVMFAVLAATLSLVSIFVPVVFMGGIVGRFFQSFAVVVVFGVLASWFVALSLTPMMCSRYLVVSEQHGKIYGFFERAFRSMESGYSRLLGFSLRHRPLVLLISGAVVASSYYFFTHVGGEFVPQEDQGRMLVQLKTPLGSSIEYTDAKLLEAEAILNEEPLITSYFTAIGLGQQGQVNQAVGFVNMVPREEREISQGEMILEMRERMAEIPGAQVFVSEVPAFSGERGEPLQFVLRGRSLNDVARYATELRDRLVETPGMGSVDLTLQLDLPQLELEVDRVRAAGVGLSAIDVAQAANVLAGGFDVARYNDDPGDGERYDIRLKAADGVFESPADLNKIFLRNRQGELVRLDTVAEFIENVGPAEIGRYDLRYAAFFFSNPTMPLAEAVATLNEVSGEVLPAGYSVQLFGQAAELGDTVGYVVFALVISLVLLYMVLASQFDSFLQPLIIMVAQPLAAIGGVAALWLLGYTMNMFSMIGMLLLVGLVAKNSILLVDLTNQRRAQGMDIGDALRDACPTRLRPVLMTSLTVIFALLPAALGYGAGADTNGPLSAAVIGGMFTSTALTLVVVPVVYSLVEGLKARLGFKIATAEGAANTHAH
ncbi:MAG: efflux RND transporter permease subunit [Pseudomonadota bacterium]|nr:efflux RND transporter permease subunit [Pseudomonadota bacterium]